MLDLVPFTIASGASVSSVANASNGLILGVYFPTMTSTTITFAGSTSNNAAGMLLVSDGAGASYSKIIAAAGNYLPLDATVFGGIPFLQIRGNTTEAAARTLYLAVWRN